MAGGVEGHQVRGMFGRSHIVAPRARTRISQHGDWVSAYRLRAIAAGRYLSRWFPGISLGGKRERGPSSASIDASRGCPRNCERIAASTTATGKLGRPDAGANSASSRDRVGDFHRFSISCLLLFLLNAVGMWATRLRCPSCPRRCPHARIVDRSARLCLADVHQDNKRRLQFWGQNRYRAGSMQVRILSRRYSWSRKP
jgi:hypothetical protein